MSGAMVGSWSYTVAAGGSDDGTRVRAIRDPADVLGEDREEMGGVDPSVKASNTACARSIKGSDVLDISSMCLDGSDRAGRSRRGTDTSGISYLLRSIDTKWGQERSPGSTVICTIASIR